MSRFYNSIFKPSSIFNVCSLPAEIEVTSSALKAFMGRLSKFLKDIREKRLRSFFRKLSWRLPNSIFYFNHSYHYSLDLEKHPPRDLSDFNVRLATREDYKLFKKINITEQLYNKRISRGDKCAIVVEDDLVNSYLWSTAGKVYVNQSGTDYDTGNDGFYAFDGYTRPEARSKGLYKYCVWRLEKSFIEEGKNYHCGSIDAHNELSIIVHNKFGFDCVGETTHYSILGLKFTFYKKWFHKRPGVRIFGKNYFKDIKDV